MNGGKLPFYNPGNNVSAADINFEQYFRTGSSRRINYSNPEFDKLIDEEQRTGDQKKRMVIPYQAGNILMEDVPFVPLYSGLARNIAWRGTPDNQILAAAMKVK